MGSHMRSPRREAVLDGYQIALAIVLFASPWLFAFVRRTVILDAWGSAVLLVFMSCAALSVFREWEEWINLVLGVWISASPWILHIQHTKAVHIMLGVGIGVVYLALLELWLIHYGHSSQDDRPLAGHPN